MIQTDLILGAFIMIHLFPPPAKHCKTQNTAEPDGKDPSLPGGDDHIEIRVFIYPARCQRTCGEHKIHERNELEKPRTSQEFPPFFFI